MKKITLFEKISSLLGEKLKGGSSLFALSRKVKQQSQYKTSHFRGETRKKSFREKWQAVKERRQQQRIIRPAGQVSVQQPRPPLRLVIFLGVVLFAGYLFVTGPLQRLYGNWSYFRIHEIEISGCLMTSPKSLRKFADISYEMNMLTLDPRAIQDRL